jgi:hypothetical protein
MLFQTLCLLISIALVPAALLVVIALAEGLGDFSLGTVAAHGMKLGILSLF